jgi:hypothetical protein
MIQKITLYLISILAISFIISHYFFWDQGNRPYYEGGNIIFRALLAVLILEPIQRLISRKPKKENKSDRFMSFIENFFIYWLILLIPTIIIYCIYYQ